MAVYKTPTLQEFLNSYRETGVDVGVYPSKSTDKDGNKHFVLRTFDPEDEARVGYNFIASFSRSSLEEMSRVPGDNDEACDRQDELDALLHDEKQCTLNYVACFCIVDEESVEGGFAKPEDIGKTFVSISTPNTAQKLTRSEVSSAKAEKKSGSSKKVTRK